jgi:hypothetical protein
MKTCHFHVGIVAVHFAAAIVYQKIMPAVDFNNGGILLPLLLTHL